jgi:hypothetical protein
MITKGNMMGINGTKKINAKPQDALSLFLASLRSYSLTPYESFQVTRPLAS